jgi:glycosyltransferase involved in cell wall biosynthesis
MKWNKENYNDFYKTQSVNFIDFPGRHAMVASLCRGHVADIGCCFGILSDYYFGEYTGFDFSSYVIDKAAEVRRKDAQFFLHDCSNLEGINIENFDTFVFSDFLEHFPNDDEILQPIFNRHKKGARIVICVPNNDKIPDPSHERTLTIPALRKKFSPYGKVKFYDWPGAEKHIMCTVDLDDKNDRFLSLVMIVKDEEKGLERAVLSCINLVDNIVIAVDSKSTDRTKEIAEAYADTLKTFDFQDDFSAARNFAHEGVTTQFIMFLDGHEYLSSPGTLENFKGADQDGLFASIELENGFTFQNPRVYRNGVKFFGKVHEKQECRNTAFVNGFLIKHNRLGAQSVAAAAARDQQRDEMVPKLMGEELKKNPKNLRALFHLGLFWQSKSNFKKALSFYSKYLKYSPNKQERWFVQFHRALCFMALNRNFNAHLAASRAEWEMPGRWETSKLKALNFFYKKKFSQALAFFVDSFKKNTVVTLYRPWAREDSVTWNLIGECFYNLRTFDKASTAFARAADLSKDAVASSLFKKRSELMEEIFKNSFSK